MKQSKKLFDAINDVEKVLIIPSTPMDGDSLGSAIAFYLWVRKIGKEAELMSFENYGGHRNSGGGTFEGSVIDAIKSITSEMEKQLKELRSQNRKEKEWINY